MKNTFASLILTLSVPAAGFACTTLMINASQQCPQNHVIGKGYDWADGAGMAIINKRGVKKTALPSSPADVPAEWSSKYASVTFNQHGREFPLGGMNEAGLTAEITMLSATQFPDSGADGKSTVNQTQWVQKILDQAGSLDEAIKLAKDVNVSSLPGAVAVPVHYFVCDKQKQCATFEYLGGRLVINKNSAAQPVTALTNDTFQDSVQDYRKYRTQPVPQKSSASLERFAIASEATKSCNADGVAKTFETLDRVRMGELTKWNIAYDPVNGKVSYRTAAAREIKTIDFKSFDGSCAQPAMMIDMNHSSPGDVTREMQAYTDAKAEGVLKQSEWYGRVPVQLQRRALAFPNENTSCTHVRGTVGDASPGRR